MRIGFRVKILANLIEKEIRASSAIEDMMKMTNMHGRIISFLHRNEDKDIYQRDIEQNFMISGPSVSEVLKLMKKNGLIEKKSVEKDARLKKIVLTEKGRQLDAEVQQSLDSVENEIISTNQGPGLVCELLRDDNGSYSKSLYYWLFQNKIDYEIISQLWHFSYCLIEHDIFFYDFNLKNFIIQKRNNHKFLYYTDLKSFENYKSWTFLKLEKIITPLARYLMIKRLRRLFKTLKISINRAKK